MSKILPLVVDIEVLCDGHTVTSRVNVTSQMLLGPLKISIGTYPPT